MYIVPSDESISYQAQLTFQLPIPRGLVFKANLQFYEYYFERMNIARSRPLTDGNHNNGAKASTPNPTKECQRQQ